MEIKFKDLADFSENLHLFKNHFDKEEAVDIIGEKLQAFLHNYISKTVQINYPSVFEIICIDQIVANIFYLYHLCKEGQKYDIANHINEEILFQINCYLKEYIDR